MGLSADQNLLFRLSNLTACTGNKPLYSGTSWRRTGWALIIAIGVFSLVFLAAPEIDIWFSALFFDEADGFKHRPDPLFHVIRMTFMYGLWTSALLTFVMFFRSLSIGERREVPLRTWGFLSAVFLVGPLGLVNGILKTFWGRARPAEIEFFGGSSTFSPPMVISDQCEANCSFVSGEGSAITTAILVYAIVIWPNLNRVWRRISLYFLLPMSILGIALRIITGRHFLSDTIFGALYCALIIWFFYAVFRMYEHRHDLTWTRFRKDLSKPQG